MGPWPFGQAVACWRDGHARAARAACRSGAVGFVRPYIPESVRPYIPESVRPYIPESVRIVSPSCGLPWDVGSYEGVETVIELDGWHVELEAASTEPCPAPAELQAEDHVGMSTLGFPVAAGAPLTDGNAETDGDTDGNVETGAAMETDHEPTVPPPAARHPESRLVDAPQPGPESPAVGGDPPGAVGLPDAVELPVAPEPPADPAPLQPRSIEPNLFDELGLEPAPDPAGDGAALRESLRFWSDASGSRAIVGTLVAVGHDTVHIRKAGGAILTVPLDGLSDVDRRYAVAVGQRVAAAFARPTTVR
jgi:hypothetical protein